MIKDYIAFDLETTGLNLETNSIIEIGALKVRNGKVVDRFMEFVRPDLPISPSITNLTGITNDMVANARDTLSIIRDFTAFCEEDILIGHNVMFDYKFMKKFAVHYGYDFEKQGLDTLKIARKTLNHLESKSLESLCEYYHIQNQSAHRAYHDALATAKLYHMLAHDFEEQYPELFGPSPLIYKRKKTQPITPRQIKYLNTLISYHNLKPSYVVEQLTRSEASRMIDLIILNHGSMREE